MKSGTFKRTLLAGLLLLLMAAFALLLSWCEQESLQPRLPKQPASSAEAQNTAETPEPVPEPTPEPILEPTPEPTPSRVYSGVWGEKFADKLTEGEVIRTENSYRSANVSVTLERVEEDQLIYYVADIYVSDIEYFRTAFANDKYNGGFKYIADISKDVGAIVAVTGDHYAGRYAGIVIRNGVFYQGIRFEDICVLYRDGRMETIDMREVDVNAIREADPWQVWSFGPELLDDEGHAKDQFNTIVYPANPRSAIGYVEPGHYYLVEVEGSRGGVWSGSRGMDMHQLAELFESLGCRSAYNLDGGRSAAITWMGELVSANYGRSIPDIICVVDYVQSTELEVNG